MPTAVTTLALFATLCAALTLYCMVSGLKALIARLRPRSILPAAAPPPRSSFRYPTTSSAYHSTVTRLQSADVMFRKAVDSHNAVNRPAKPTLSQQLFPTSSASSQQPAKLSQTTLKPPNPARPLATTTGNTVKTSTTSNACGGYRQVHTGTNGIKRTASGLVKALDSEDAFGEQSLPSGGTQQNPYVVEDVTPAKKTATSTFNDISGVYFDENDFEDDNDLDLDVEDPATKGTVAYPSLPTKDTKTPKTNSVSKAAQPPAANVSKPRVQEPQRQGRWDERSDSGYVSQRPQQEDEPPQGTVEIPWSSSPIEHTAPQPQAAALKRFMYNGAGDGEEKSRPAKRRTIPWLPQEKHEAPAKKESNFTPLPTDSKLPWNTSATTIKQMQKSHREVNKRPTKTGVSGDQGLIADSLRTKKSKLSKVFLSDEQAHVLNMVINDGRSVFFTGSAGTGKSVLLREIITALRRKYSRDSERIAVTASTGLAACNIGGVTLHSFAGIGLGNQPTEELIKKIKRNQKHKHRWMRVKVLVIDEVSMIDGELFDKLEQIARTLRNNGRPFGGIQLVITGDFFQLPPVPDKKSVARFCFDANTWNTVIEHTIGLTHIFRQKDPVFAGMLNEMREGRLSQSSIAAFKALSRPLSLDGGLEATELFPLRQEVDMANRKRMSMLHGDVRTYEAKDGGSITDKAYRDKLLANCMAPEAVSLKKGAQVMLIKNIDETLVNGSLGRVIGFMSEAMFDNYQENEAMYHGGVAPADVDDPEERMRQEQRRRAKITDLLSNGSNLYPVVRFSLADGTTRDLLCQRESWKVELPNGEVQASRSQVPLILAWALSIHKAQGQTLERVKVDLGRVFEKGQAYVALSRATSMAGLQVLNFDPRKVVAHDKVRAFYASLAKVQEMAPPVKKKGEKKQQKLMTAEEYEKSVVEDAWADEGSEFAYGV